MWKLLFCVKAVNALSWRFVWKPDEIYVVLNIFTTNFKLLCFENYVLVSQNLALLLSVSSWTM